MMNDRITELENALAGILVQLPAEPNATSMSYGVWRGRKYYLRRLSIESIEAARRALPGHDYANGQGGNEPGHL